MCAKCGRVCVWIYVCKNCNGGRWINFLIQRFCLSSHSLSLSCNCFSCAVCALVHWNCFMQLPISPSRTFLLNVWFYANVNTVNGQCVCVRMWSGTRFGGTGQSEWMRVFYTFIFVLLLRHLIISNAIFSVCLSIANLRCRRRCFCVVFWCRFVCPSILMRSLRILFSALLYHGFCIFTFHLNVFDVVVALVLTDSHRFFTRFF